MPEIREDDRKAPGRNGAGELLIGATVGAGSAGANILMVVFGGQDVYANLGAGNELDIAPGQVISQEAGLAVRTSSRRVPVWDVWKQPNRRARSSGEFFG